MKLRNPVRDVRTIKTLLEGAEAEAHAAGEPQPGAEHLLLAALALPDGTAQAAFAAVGVDPDAVRAAIAGVHADALRAVGVEPPAEDALDAAIAPGSARGAYRSRASARTAFTAASDLARSGDGPLSGAHVVAAVADLEHGTAPRALAALGVDRAALAAAARDLATRT